MAEKLTEQDGVTPIFFRAAREHEVIFRGVLAHIKSTSSYIPPNFNVESPIDLLLPACNPQPAYGQFDVYNFQVGRSDHPGSLDKLADMFKVEVSDTDALIEFGNVGVLSGGGAAHIYTTSPDSPPVFRQAFAQMLR